MIFGDVNIIVKTWQQGYHLCGLDQLQISNPKPDASDVKEFIPINKDLGSRRKILTDDNREFLINLGPFQPKLGLYPRNNDIPHSKQCRFSLEWFLEFPHLEYSIVKDAAFCFVCQLLPTGVAHEKCNLAWAVENVRQWHKMKGRGKSKQGKLAGHFSSKSHKASLDALVTFQHKFNHKDKILDRGREAKESRGYQDFNRYCTRFGPPRFVIQGSWI